MKRIKKLDTPPRFISWCAVGGYEEKNGPLGEAFDLCDESDTFGQKTWEMSEGEMGRCALNLALSKCSLSHETLELLVAGDLQNQCVASSVGLDSFGAPFLGIYGACSTCTEALLILSSMIESGAVTTGACVTTSHNSAAERQFRTPLEYGGQRSPSAQWTSTAAGSFVLTSDEELIKNAKLSNVAISDFMIGRIVDGATADGSNMGAAMSFAAAESIIEYFKESELKPRDFDYIVTGDLGKVGTSILRAILEERLPSAAGKHLDCGNLLYDAKRQDVHAGASGCGTSASVLASYFLPRLEEGEIRDILFLSTGALMSPSSVLQGNTIKGIAPVIHIHSSAD
ncbi:MAG: stage V sporulation protein AD [Clostridia bacterium]|nr:stage V sporulation protein AD [Clostridia bacterium]